MGGRDSLSFRSSSLISLPVVYTEKNRPNTVFLEPEDVANDRVVGVCGVEQHSTPSDDVCIVCRRVNNTGLRRF